MLAEERKECGRLLFGDGRVVRLLVELPLELDELLHVVRQGYDYLVLMVHDK